MLWSVWLVVAGLGLLATGLEAGSEVVPANSRHHRHRHYHAIDRDRDRDRDQDQDQDQIQSRGRDLGATRSRRLQQDWDGTRNNDLYERDLTQRRGYFHPRRRIGQHRATTSGWYHPRGSRGRPPFRPDHYGSTSSKWWVDYPRRAGYGRGPRRGRGRYDLRLYPGRWGTGRGGSYSRSYEDPEEYEDYDRDFDAESYYDDYEAGEVDYAPVRQPKKPRHRVEVGGGTGRRKYKRPVADNEEEDADDESEEYDEYDYEDSLSASRRRPSKRPRNEERGIIRRPGEDISGHGHRRYRKRYHQRPDEEEPEDLNEVGDQDEEEEEDDYPWNNNQEEEEYPKSETKRTPLTLTEIIQKLSTNLDPTTSEDPIRRDYRNTEKDTWAKEKSTEGTTKSYSTERQDEVTESTSVRSDQVTTVSNTNASSVISVPTREGKSTDLSKETIDDQPHTKSLDESEFDEYENDAGEENDEKQDYADATDIHAERVSSSADDREPDYAEDDEDDESEEDSELPEGSIKSNGSSSTTLLPWSETPQLSLRASKMIEVDHDSFHLDRQRLLPTRSATTATTKSPKLTNYSRHKWETLGNRAGVEQARRGLKVGDPDLEKARSHYEMVSREGSCRWPRKRLVPVKEVFPNPAKTYLPHCVILHRCTDDTGCCRDDRMTCVPKRNETVEFYLYSITDRRSTVVEKLKFENHTECQCIRKEKPPEIPQNKTRVDQRDRCTCPGYFVAKMKKGQCECNCPDEISQPCTRLKRGKSAFSLRDHLCIIESVCTAPRCEFGEYMSEKTRCPTREEKLKTLDIRYGKHVDYASN